VRAVGAAVVKVNWMVAVEVRAGRNEIGVPVPDCASVVCCIEHERVGVLAQTVQAGASWQAGAETDVLALEDKRGGGGVKEGLVGAATEDREAEGRLDVVEDEVCARGTAVAGRGGAVGDGGRHLVDLVACILDLDMQSLIWPSVSRL